MINCPHCGAPLDPDLQNGALHCEYCEARVAPPKRAVLLEDVIDFGHDAGIDCPVCQQRLTSALLDDHKAAYCSGCRGLLLADEVFAQTVRSRRARFHGREQTPLPIDPSSLERRLICGRCRRPMQTHPYFGPGATVIDSCHPCGLIWLDAGELTQIEVAVGRR